MINSLFSSFEPQNFNLLSILLIPLSLISLPTVIENNPLIINNIIHSSLLNELNPISNSNFFNSIILSIFITLSIYNIFSLTPISFTLSSLASVVLPTSTSIFLIILLLITNNSNTSILIHLTPNGSPLILSFFLVIVEFISLIIRPITLSVRLISNIIAGHLIIHLLNNLILINNSLSLITIIPSFTLLTAEIGICFIQAYIFCILLTIYLNE